MKQLLILIIVLTCVSFSFGQKSYQIKQADGAFTIDGELSEEQWKDAQLIEGFVVSYPNFGEESEFASKVRVLYDNEAVYIGGILHDNVPDSVSYSLSQRDDPGNADWFGVSIDPYGNNVTAFTFMVTSAGVELDALEYPEGPDFTWNAVWRSATKRRKDGWSVEMRIPFSAIRFPNQNIQQWNVNFARQVRRNRELSFWNPVDPAVFGEITQSGVAKGIKNIDSPLRLSLTPYVTGYLQNAYDEKLNKQVWKNRVTGGVDLKYGINDAFTLDMTLVPDFGQTTSDKQVLNLGPFEVRYNENRPFFLEGMDLFGIGGVFYSRRIGGTPYNYSKPYYAASADEEVVANPLESPLINAMKVSGRTKNGLGIGVFNAVEGRASAIIADSLGNEREIETNPMTNYNVLVLSQNLKNNSSVSFVNTHVFREGQNADANVSVLESSLFSNDKDYKLTTSVKFSSVFRDDEPVLGHDFYTSLSKVSGNWGYTLAYGERSDTYDPNDLGFIYNNNDRSYSLAFRFNDYTPGKHFLRRWSNVNLSYSELYKPQLFSYLTMSWSAAGTMKNFLTWGVNGYLNPIGGVNHFESRVFGKEIYNQPNVGFGAFYSSDYSKVFALDFRPGIRFYAGTQRQEYSMNISPRVRASDRLFFVWGTSFQFLNDDFGYVSKIEDYADYSLYENDIILGVRDRSIVENSLSMEFIFTKRMGIDLRLRHYWQQVRYDYFIKLLDDAETELSGYMPVDDNGNSRHNTSYNAFTLDVNYRWVFIPGSELRIVYKNNIFNSKAELDPSYFGTFNTLFDQPQINSVSMKLLVYVDAIYFRRKNRSKINGDQN